MAAENFGNPPAPPPPAPSLPEYPEMIMAAIEALDDGNGANKTAIGKHLEDTYVDLPEDHVALLSNSLDKMKESGDLVLVKNQYMKPDPTAPPKRGRGRPPKPKVPVQAGVVASPPRPRGRPPKPRDPFAPPPQTKTPSGTGRPRGRPPKKAKTTPSAPAPAPSLVPTPPPVTAPAPAPATATATGAPRGRGRPPKVKQTAVAPVGC